MKKLLVYIGWFCLGSLMGFIFPLTGNASTAHVTFDTHPNPAYRTVVLVSEVSGDYSGGYGQISEPGVDNVDIGNIVRGKDYFFVAYRLADNGDKSINSEEYPFTAPVGEDPVLIELPPIEISGAVLNISISVQ